MESGTHPDVPVRSAGGRAVGLPFLRAAALWADTIKLHHSVFAMPFALMAAFLAGWHRPSGRPSAVQLVLIVLCMVAARSAAMTFNRIVDATIDAANPRTAGRAIPTGRLSLGRARAFFAVCCVVFVAGTAGFRWLEGNPWPLRLAVPVLAYLCFYSYTKRFTRWSHFVLGSGIALSPPAAWLAVDPGSLGAAALVLTGAVMLWIGGFDILYACQDASFDRRAGLHSLPASVGIGAALWMARAAHAATVVLLAALIPLTPLGAIYGIGVGAVAVLLAIENALVRPGDLSRVNVAFFTINGMVSVLLGVAAIAELVLARSGAA